ncbi:transcriptional regulator, TetR family [Goodfellowiella coeruleoviolacea]|uniref:Transcriptional regulator, TetR family n=1 Tax=Goodfellowiella coeruleoviolacea TaxID=334858 RepID=A0AAE3KJD0_9PSEU|nr:transcriptional regulator, TetR family [Goodfellowiella coeruleoviolacea]
MFAAGGAAASTEEVAQRAGVGIATVFRHFPTKEALLQAIVVGRLRALAREADESGGDGDAGTAFFAFFRRVIGQAAARTAYLAALADTALADTALSDTGPNDTGPNDTASSDTGPGRTPGGGSAVDQAGQDLLRAVGALLGRAQRAGAVRADLRPAEVIALLVGAARAVEHAGCDTATRDRILDVVFTGLRAGS